MRIQQWNKKWLVSELTNPEKMHLRKNGLTVKTVGPNLELEDNIFNRILLGISWDEKIHNDIPHSIYEQISVNARNYQRVDISNMLLNKCTLNRNKPGYGKTFESIEYCRVMGFKRILIICPKSVTHQWKQQFERWWTEVAQYVVVGGAGPKRGETSIFVTNYEQFTPINVSKDKRKKQLVYPQVWMRCKEWTWDCIICDESHRIKNPRAQITDAVKQLPSRHRLALTGTPILGRPDDLWSQLHFLDPFYSGSSYQAFMQRFCEMEHGYFADKPIGLTPSESARDLLGKALALISVGGENHKVTEGKNQIVIELEMPAWQRNLYKDIVNLALDSLDKKDITVKNAMDQMIKMQQATTNPQVLIKDEERNPKFEWVKDWLEDNESEKVVIFTKYAEAAKALDKYLKKYKIDCITYIGEMSGKDRLKARDEFVQRSACRVIIGTIGALGTGVDELQYATNNVIFLDRDWTPGINEQAEDRVNRSGQVGMTNIWKLYMKNSIDSYVEGIITKKAEDIEEVFKHVRDSIRSGE